jgi:hypothetical protein
MNNLLVGTSDGTYKYIFHLRVEGGLLAVQDTALFAVYNREKITVYEADMLARFAVEQKLVRYMLSHIRIVDCLIWNRIQMLDL